MGRRKGETPLEERKAQSYRMKQKASPGFYKKYLAHTLKEAAYPDIDLNDSVAVVNRVDTYFKDCQDDDCQPTVAGLANAIHVSRAALNKWVSGHARNGSDQVDSVKRAYLIMNALQEAYMQEGASNPIGQIFLMCNNFGYEQKAVHEVHSEPQITAEMSPEQLANRYNSDIIDAETVPHKQITGSEKKG